MNVRGQTWEELRARLIRVRSFPPSMWNHLGGTELNALRAELLALPPEIDLLRWLREHQAEEISQAAFRNAVASISGRILGKASLRSVDPTIPAVFDQWSALEEVRPDESVEDLENRLRAIQAANLPLDLESHHAAVPSNERFALDTPIDVRPLDWYRDRGLEIAAMVILQMIANLSLLPRPDGRLGFLIDRVLHVSATARVLLAESEMSLEIRRVYLGEDGFRVPAAMSFRLKNPPEGRHFSLYLPKFVVARDDLGANYLTSGSRGSTSTSAGDAFAEFGFWPALSERATTLTIGFSAAQVLSRRWLRVGDRPQDHPSESALSFGEVLVEIPLTGPAF